MSFCKSLQRRKLAAVLWHGLCTSSKRGAPQVVIGTLTSYQEIKFEHRAVQKNSSWVVLCPSSLVSCLYHIEHYSDINKCCHSAFVDLIFIVFHCLCRYVCRVTLAEDRCCRTSWTYLQDQGNAVKYRSDAHMWQRWFKRKLLGFWKTVTPLHMHTYIHTYIHLESSEHNKRGQMGVYMQREKDGYTQSKEWRKKLPFGWPNYWGPYGITSFKSI